MTCVSVRIFSNISSIQLFVRLESIDASWIHVYRHLELSQGLFKSNVSRHFSSHTIRWRKTAVHNITLYTCKTCRCTQMCTSTTTVYRHVWTSFFQCWYTFVHSLLPYEQREMYTSICVLCFYLWSMYIRFRTLNPTVACLVLFTLLNAKMQVYD